MENREWILRRVPDPLGLIAVHGRRAGGQRREIECDDRQAAHVAVVAEDGDGELRSGEICLDENRLVVALEQERDAFRELCGRPA